MRSCVLVEWKKYQEEVAEFFRELGLNATTDAPVKGVRTGHDVDVLVEANYMGITMKWIVECKRWKTRVTKLHVLALRTIVDDVGADRGFVMSERGHQKGAREAAFLSNVQLTSLQDLRETCRHELGLLRVRELYRQAGECRARYREFSKKNRIRYGLRGEYGGGGNSGTRIIDALMDAMTTAAFGGFPVTYSETKSAFSPLTWGLLSKPDDAVVFQTPAELADFVETALVELDRLLSTAEAGEQPA